MPYTHLPILLTATIAPPSLPGLGALDPGQRWTQYEVALRFWILRRNVSAVVFCENSGYAVDYAPITNLAARLGKTLEVMTYSGNEGALTKGRGYGEGEIIRHALVHSVTLSNYPGFFKATGRLMVTNFNLLEWMTRIHPVVMSERSAFDHGWVDTRFYKMDRQFYMDHLLNVHCQADRPDWVLGKGYARVLAPRRVPSFPLAVRIVGESGNGVRYDDDAWRYVVKSMLAQVGYYCIRRS